MIRITDLNKSIYTEYQVSPDKEPLKVGLLIDKETGKATLNVETDKIQNADEFANTFGPKAIREGLKDIITPGFVLFILSYVIYYISSKGAMVYLWDEATHWGTTAKRMAYTSKLWTTGLQTIASPIFNFVMLKTTGFKESALYLSQWTLSIACIILPLSHIKWNKVYFAFIYFVGCVLGLSLICLNGNLTLYADNILALFFSSMLLAWYLDKKFSYKKYIWSCFGIFMLVQIKTGTGISLAVLFIIFIASNIP